MKLQTLAVIFAIIIIPISMVLSKYVQTQVDTLVIQTSYDTKLSNATYDALKAFQLNETNSNTYNIATYKIENIEASLKSFYNSLGTNLGASEYGENYLRPYIPAIVYTLYDGYYIYSKGVETIDTNGNTITHKGYGLKPYIYYSCRYTNNENTDVTINYTLDNYITVYGKVNGNYVTKSGYLINLNDFPNGCNDTDTSIKYGNIKIDSEDLSEINYDAVQNNSKIEENYFYQKITDNKDTRYGAVDKVYYDITEWQTKSRYIYSIEQKKIETKNSDWTQAKEDESAINYYKEAYKFSTWVNDNLRELTEKQEIENIGWNTNNIFNLNGNDPETENSAFNEHKRKVIKNAIKTNLTTAISNYGDSNTYAYRMPELKETEWDKILNNVSIISFMQGIPIGNKYYTGYSVITNNKNREFVDPKELYFIDGNNKNEYAYITDIPKTAVLTGYRNIDFERKKIVTQTQTYYYYPHLATASYNSIIAPNTYKTSLKTFLNKYVNNVNDYYKMKAYYTALARERYVSYKPNNFGNE